MNDAPSSLARAADAPDDDVWSILRMILWSAEYLGGKGVETGRLDAEHLLAHVLGMQRLQLYLQYERPLTPDELDAYRPLLKRRAAREPLQHIVGVQPFRELDLEVDGSVLVPRPETEVLVQAVLDWAKESGRPDLQALDVGTGSGAIALSLALEGPFARVLATDVDEGALRMARKNRASAGLDERVELRPGDLFQALGDDERFDVVVSNPPYIPEGEADGLQPEVREWEPRRALFGGTDGLDVFRGLVDGASRHVVPGGLLALEVGLGQAPAVVELIQITEKYDVPRVLRDYSGRERFVLAHGRR
ncbi:MAG: peptide chain release factor N(5)-glutamine methyltransferase [Gemmatimonadetes bacterium]|nr:peptide chain release factor N(5)-glutamine methyltransferase [Gemmatimonadota bacterium]